MFGETVDPVTVTPVNVGLHKVHPVFEHISESFQGWLGVDGRVAVLPDVPVVTRIVGFGGEDTLHQVFGGRPVDHQDGSVTIRHVGPLCLVVRVA